MKKYFYLIIIVLFFSLVLAGCSLLSDVGQVPTTEQSGITYLTKNPGLYDPVGLWHFDDDALDSSGTVPPNNGTVYGGASYVVGQFGKALSFDGINDYVEVPHPIAANSAITMEAWVNVSTPLSVDAEVISKWDGVAAGAPIHFEIRNTDLKVRMGLRYGPGSSDYIVNFYSTEALPANQWVHVAEVWDGTTATIYFDGVAKGSASGSGTIYHNASMKYWIGSLSTLGRYFKGTIDEVRIWDTATPSFNLNVEPELDFNPIGTDHTVTATVTIPAPGVLVDFTVSGANSDNGSAYTDSNGVATFAYTGSYAGMDTILAEINEAPYAYVFDEVTKYWLENFVTGGGKINTLDGKKAAWTFAGTVGNLEDGSVGQFQIVDHTNKITYHCNNDFSSLVFSGGTAESPMASHNTATFTGTFTNNRDATTVDITVTIQDLGEPGAGTDKISVTGFIALSTTLISGGNFQVHDL